MREAGKRVEAGQSVVRLEVGQPAFGAPGPALAAVREALGDSPLGYTDTPGLDALRTRIARHYAETYGVRVPSERILVTTGSSGGFVLAFLAAFDAGARVGLGVPGYPAYPTILKALGVEPVAVPLSSASGYRMTADRVAAAGDLQGVVVANPSNPTGTLLDGDVLRDLSALADARSQWLVVDEIYHGITYGPPAETILSYTDDAIVVSSFSKFYGLAGWRIGWLILPEMLVEPVERLAQSLFISPPTVSQIAAMAVFDGMDELRERVSTYARSRDRLCAALEEAGFGPLSPVEGAFYVYAGLSEAMRMRLNGSLGLTEALLEEGGVALTPGLDFDPDHGSGFVRLSFAGPEAEVEEGCRRLVDWARSKGFARSL
jgi:aspartate/methionine/tyrosine aminotransferase